MFLNALVSDQYSVSAHAVRISESHTQTNTQTDTHTRRSSRTYETAGHVRVKGQIIREQLLVLWAFMSSSETTFGINTMAEQSAQVLVRVNACLCARDR